LRSSQDCYQLWSSASCIRMSLLANNPRRGVCRACVVFSCVCSHPRHGQGHIKPRRRAGAFWVGLFTSGLVSVGIESQAVVALEEGKQEHRTMSAMDEQVSRRNNWLTEKQTESLGYRISAQECRRHGGASALHRQRQAMCNVLCSGRRVQ
jgi:hypothetical protein